jgi:ribosomal protein L11 methylase PrmA
VDVEAPSIEATEENARVNGVTVEAHLVAGDEQLPPAQTAVANISLASVEALPGRIDVARLVTSGYLASEQPQLPGFRHVERRSLGGWASDLYERA